MAQASTYFPKVRRMLLFHAPSILTRFWPASTLLRGHLALAILSPLEIDPQILERWSYAYDFHLANISERRILVSNFGMTCNSLCEFYTLDWLRHVGSLPENRLRRRHVLKYATQLPCIRWLTLRWILSRFFITPLPRFPRSIVTLVGNRFSFLPISFLQQSHCTFVIILFRPLTRLFINLKMCIRALFPKPATILGLVEQAFWRVSLFSEWVDASYFEVILARPSRRSTAGTPASGTSGSRWFSLILLHGRIRRRIWWCNFSTLIRIVAETAIVSFYTLPAGFPLPTISKNSLYTLFCSMILDHGVLLKISISAPKFFFFRISCSILFFFIVFNLW